MGEEGMEKVYDVGHKGLWSFSAGTADKSCPTGWKLHCSLRTGLSPQELI